MSNGSEFNDLDGALQRLFDDSAPLPAEPAALILERIGPRMVWARRRRIAGQATTAVAAAVGAIGLGVALLPSNPEPETIVMADGDADGLADQGTASTGNITDSTTPPTVDSEGLGGPVATTTAPPTEAPTSAPADTAAPIETTTSTSAPTTQLTTTTTTALELVDVVFTSPGGSVSVRWSSAGIELIATNANPGYEAEVTENGPIRVDVEFEQDGSDVSHEIELELIDGELVRHQE